MPPLVAGVITALVFASSTLTSARASRLAGAPPVLAGVMLVGLVLVAPWALVLSPLPATPAITPLTMIQAFLAGAANVGGLLLIYAALQIGAVGVISTIASTEGALAATISVLAGQALAPGVAPVLALIAAGVVLAATSGGHELEEGVAISRARSLRAAGLAAVAAIIFGVGLFLTGRVSDTLPAAWVILPGRIVGVGLVALPLVLTARLRIPRAALPFVVSTGITEVVGFSTFTIGAQGDIALTAVLASMFAPVAAVAAFVLFRERLAARQILGIALVVVGIAIVAVLTA
jgi:drug/metabolite transporter (DMT)-like permease